MQLLNAFKTLFSVLVALAAMGTGSSLAPPTQSQSSPTAKSKSPTCPGRATWKCHLAGCLFLWHYSERLYTYRLVAL